MLWRKAPQALSIPDAAPVPDAEALRRAALQASWQRDRWVARRRVWLRWLMWISGRYLMPAMLVFGAGAWLWLGLLPGMGVSTDALTLWKTPAPRLEAPEIVRAPPPIEAPPPQALPAPQEASFSPEGEELQVPLSLRFDSRWAPSARSGTLTVAVPSTPDTLTPTLPPLKPENWLHSKEP